MKYTTTINLLNYVNAWSETFYIARLMYNSVFAHCWCLCLASINICSLLTLSYYMVMKLCMYQKFIFSLEIVIILVILSTFSLLLGAMRLLDTGKYSQSGANQVVRSNLVFFYPLKFSHVALPISFVAIGEVSFLNLLICIRPIWLVFTC